MSAKVAGSKLDDGVGAVDGDVVALTVDNANVELDAGVGMSEEISELLVEVLNVRECEVLETEGATEAGKGMEVDCEDPDNAEDYELLSIKALERDNLWLTLMSVLLARTDSVGCVLPPARDASPRTALHAAMIVRRRASCLIAILTSGHASEEEWTRMLVTQLSRRG